MSDGAQTPRWRAQDDEATARPEVSMRELVREQHTRARPPIPRSLPVPSEQRVAADSDPMAPEELAAQVDAQAASADEGERIDPYALTDDAAARLFLEQCPIELKYARGACWYAYRAPVWVRDVDLRYARGVALDFFRRCHSEFNQRLQQEAARIVPGETKKDRKERLAPFVAPVAWCERILSGEGVDRVLKHAEASTEFNNAYHVDPQLFDAHRDLIAFRDVTVDLSTATTQPHRREDFLTVFIDRDYDPYAQCPKFERHIERLTQTPDDAELMKFNMGTILSDFGFQNYVVNYGPSGTGKTTLAEAIKHALGPGLCHVASSSGQLLFNLRSASASVRDYEIAELEGKRFLYVDEWPVDESGEALPLNETLCQTIADGGMLKGRAIRQAHRTFRSGVTIWINTNPVPKFTTTEENVTRRMTLMKTRSRDASCDFGQLASDLKAEADGILALMVRYSAKLDRKKLFPRTQGVRDALLDVSEQNNSALAFFRQSCELSSEAAHLTNGPTADDVYQAYRRFCERTGIKRVYTATLFGTMFNKIPGVVRKRSGRGNYYAGLDINEPSRNGHHVGSNS